MIKRKIVQLVPPALLNARSRWRGVRALSRVDRLEFNAGPLGLVDRQGIDSILRDPALDQRWTGFLSAVGELNPIARAGGVNFGDRRAIFYLASALTPVSVLEIGTHIGASTLFLAGAASLLPGDEKRRVTTVDIIDVNDPVSRPWQATEADYSPNELLSRAGLREYVDFVARPSLDFMSTTQNSFDLIFLDGDHAADTVYREVQVALGLLNPGGFILLHDYFPDGKPLWSNKRVLFGPWLAVNRMQAEGAGLKVEPLGSLPWETKLNSTVSSLALLTRSSGAR